MMIFLLGNLTSSQTGYSCSWRGFAASSGKTPAWIRRMTGAISRRVCRVGDSRPHCLAESGRRVYGIEEGR
jgi:hypothetical protein